ncbi:MAG: acyl-CoA thioesterase [Anaerolineales bacterium]|jgi:acyl-CoA thioester hydrolase
MESTEVLSEPIYPYEFTIPDEAVDENGHVNNVMYVQWMQDAAVRHYEAMGGRQITIDIGATWVVRSHMVEYLRPAFAGERIKVLTWVVNMRRVRSLRRYQFIRMEDEQLLVRGETDWVFVDMEKGSPRAIPPEVSSLFKLLPDEVKT